MRQVNALERAWGLGRAALAGEGLPDCHGRMSPSCEDLREEDSRQRDRVMQSPCGRTVFEEWREGW